MRAMLSKMGYFEVITAEDGEQVANPILLSGTQVYQLESSDTQVYEP